MRFKKSVDEFFEPRYKMTPEHPDTWQQTHYRYMVEKVHQGWKVWYCLLCDKQADDGHAGSKMHKERLQEMAAADEMIGCCNSCRRFEKTCGLASGLTRLRMISTGAAICIACRSCSPSECKMAQRARSTASSRKRRSC